MTICFTPFIRERLHHDAKIGAGYCSLAFSDAEYIDKSLKSIIDSFIYGIMGLRENFDEKTINIVENGR